MDTVAAMSNTLTMNRVIHDAVRRDLERLVLALEGVPDGDSARARDLERAFANLRNELTHHHEGEDRWIWPMLAKVGVDPDLLATMESEHHSMSEALAETGAAMKDFAASGSATDATAARESVVRAQSVVEQHLTHEEEDLEPVLIPHFESAEWKEVEKLLSRQPPSVAGPFFAWVTDGISDQDRTFLRSTVPTPVTFVLGRVFGRRYYRDIAPVWQAGPT
jgi:hemerythrin-like domain-containing protein